MKTALLLFYFISSFGVLLANEDWEKFKKLYGKVYKSNTEEYFRKRVFLNNLNEIEKHNELFTKGKSTFTMGITEFTDLLNQEYKSLMKSQKPNSNKGFKHERQSWNRKAAPDAVDWRTSGCVRSPQDQGQMCDPWPIVSTVSIEVPNCVHHGQLVRLSEQNLIDCSSNEGCGQGTVDNAYIYVEQAGIDTEASYPTTGIGECKFNPNTVGATISGFVDIPSGDEISMADDLANYGPVAVAVDASNLSFQLYVGGIYYEPACSSVVLDHVMLAVGYGSEDGLDYWIVQNSWGTAWGEQGYIRMSRNKDNNCGIATMASFPIVN